MYFFDTSLDVSVPAVCFSQDKSGGASAKELIKRILCKWIEKKDSYAIPKNVRFGK